MMPLDWSEYAKLERGAALPVDESLLVMLRERRKGPERVEATEITLAEDPLFAIERRIEEEGDDGETRLTSRIEYVFFSYEEAETYLEQFKYRLHGCRLTVLPTFGSLKRVLRAGEFLDEIERRWRREATMERHEFDAAYARICKVCGMKTQTELSAYLGIRQSSISDAKRRMMIPAAWLLTLLTREGVNPAWILTGGGSKFLVPASLPPSASTLLLARLAGPELEQRIRAGLMSVTECIAEEIRALAEGKEEKGE